MQTIRNNPFRMLGLPVNSTEKQIAKRISDVKIYAEMGKPIKYDTDFLFISEIKRTPENIRKAVSEIERPQRKLFYSLFWFYQKTSVDELCFELLVDGKADRARELWQKTIDKKSSTANVFYSYKNLISLYLLDAQKKTESSDELLSALSLGIDSLAFMLNDDQMMEEYVREICGEKNSIEIGSVYKDLAEEIHESCHNYIGVNKAVSVKEFISILSNLPKSMQSCINGKYVNSPLQRIEEEIKEAEYNKEESPCDADKHGEALYQKTKSDIDFLAEVLTVDNTTYKTIADKLANAIEQCAITFYNDAKEDVETTEAAKKLLQYSKAIAVGMRLKEKIERGMDVIEKNEEYFTLAKRCWFCQKGNGQNTSNVTVHMHGEVKRQWMVTGTRVTWKKYDVTVPRCMDCKKIHGKRDTASTLRWVLSICAIIGGFVVGSEYESTAGTITAIAGIIAVFSIIKMPKLPKGVKSSDDYDNFPTIKELKRVGWKYGSQPSNVR